MLGRGEARSWLAREPGAVGQAVHAPMGYRFIVFLNGTRVGVVTVNGVTGAVVGHALGSGSSGWTDNWSGMMGGNGSSGWGHMMGDWSTTSGWGGMMMKFRRQLWRVRGPPARDRTTMSTDRR